MRYVPHKQMKDIGGKFHNCLYVLELHNQFEYGFSRFHQTICISTPSNQPMQEKVGAAFQVHILHGLLVGAFHPKQGQNLAFQLPV